MKSRLKVVLITLSLVLVVSGCKSLSISINDTNPPVFTFSAGQFAECCTHLAFLIVYEVPAGNEDHKVIWQIRPKSGTDNSAEGLPQITYGEVPEGFEQLVPSDGTPPALQEGKVYAASGPRVEVPEAFVMFRIQNGKAIRMSSKLTQRLPANGELSASVVPLSDIHLASIGRIAPKGRVQDAGNNNSTVVTSVIQHGKEAIPYLISKLDDETKIDGHVIDYWYEVRVADVAFIILTDLFTDSSLRNTTVPGVGWDEFLERGGNGDLTAQQVLRNYISKHGRQAIKDRWQALWLEYRDRLSWDENERCFRVTPNYP
jgi:hypothetical protein